MLSIVGQILVEISKTIWILTQAVIDNPKLISSRLCPEPLEVNEVESRDVVGLASEMIPPETSLPEPELVHLLVVIAEWSVGVRSSLDVHARERKGQGQSQVGSPSKV